MQFNLSVKNVKSLAEFVRAISVIGNVVKGVRSARRERIRRMTNEQLDEFLDSCSKIPVVMQGLLDARIEIDAAAQCVSKKFNQG